MITHITCKVCHKETATVSALNQDDVVKALGMAGWTAEQKDGQVEAICPSCSNRQPLQV